ncbi:MAG: dephospho-CoA kinase [Bacteroidales bacterium]|nr:dephospho-CoA kinase [Bacteroidales bacterium]
MKYAITGGIGSGKSHICRLLQKHGIDIYDCDAAAKRIVATSEKVRRQLQECVGMEVFHTDGSLNKPMLAEFLLKSDENTAIVNHIVHPAVAEDFVQSGKQWMECAILFSSGFNRLVDRVVCVTAPLEVRLDRIVKRDGITREKAREWIDKQWPQQKVAELSDFVIVNDGTADLESQIDAIINE